MNLKSLNELELVAYTRKTVEKERRATSEVLRLLEEIEQRSIHLKRGYASLHAFAVGELRYSDAAAARRIHSMRLLKTLPIEEKASVEHKINQGEVHLSNLSTLQGFFVQERKSGRKSYSTQDKLKLLKEIESKSYREVQKRLAEISPEFGIPQEKERILTSDRSELKLVVDEKTLRKLKRLKELRSHVNPAMSYAELLDWMSDELLKRVDPLQKVRKPKKEGIGDQETSEAHASTPAPERLRARVRAIPNSIKRRAYLRAQGRCEYRDAHSAKVCGSTHLIQYDHVFPWSKGGEAVLDNIQLLCAQHNQRKSNRLTGSVLPRRQSSTVQPAIAHF